MSWGPVGISHDCPLSLNTSTHTHVLWALCRGPLHATIARPISHLMKMISRGAEWVAGSPVPRCTPHGAKGNRGG